MELRVHFLIEILVFIALYYFLGFYSALIIAAVHFIPTIDYIMLELRIKAKLHRKLFHNIFVALIAGLALYYFLGPLVALLGFLNILFHFVLDMNLGGVEIFYPVSKYRLKLRRKAQ